MSFDLFETLDPFLISPEEKLFLSPGIAPQEAKLNVLFKLYVQHWNTKRILISIRKQCKQILVQIFFIRLPLGRQQNQKRKDRLCGWRNKMFQVSLQTFRPCLLSLSHTQSTWERILYTLLPQNLHRTDILFRHKKLTFVSDNIKRNK